MESWFPPSYKGQLQVTLVRPWPGLALCFWLLGFIWQTLEESLGHGSHKGWWELRGRKLLPLLQTLEWVWIPGTLLLDLITDRKQDRIFRQEGNAMASENFQKKPKS